VTGEPARLSIVDRPRSLLADLRALNVDKVDICTPVGRCSAHWARQRVVRWTGRGLQWAVVWRIVKKSRLYAICRWNQIDSSIGNTHASPGRTTRIRLRKTQNPVPVSCQPDKYRDRFNDRPRPRHTQRPAPGDHRPLPAHSPGKVKSSPSIPSASPAPREIQTENLSVLSPARRSSFDCFSHPYKNTKMWPT
jgi:hypothetical protein